MKKLLVISLIVLGLGIFLSSESAFASHLGYFGLFVAPAPALVGPPAFYRGYYHPPYYGPDYYSGRYWVPGHWESRWILYGWQRIWVPGYWQ